MPKPAYDLTDAERRDLTQLIAEARPLPEKYRFILFEDKREVELVWNGKTRDVCTTVLPFQTLEHVDEPRAETKHQGDLFDSRGRQLRGWTNKLIWGDNKLILSSLKAGPLRQQIEDAGGLKLIYIDPPFDVGADFGMDIEIGDETFHKEPNLLEQIAYRDTWGRGTDSFIAMLFERLILMRDLMSPDGSIWVHSDWRVNSVVNMAVGEVFGGEVFQNGIIWFYTNKYGANLQTFESFNNTLYWFGKSRLVTYNPIRVPVKQARKHPLRKWNKELGENEWHRDTEGNYLYVDSFDKEVSDVWAIPVINPMAIERVGYPTQKPEALLERISLASS